MFGATAARGKSAGTRDGDDDGWVAIAYTLCAVSPFSGRACPCGWVASAEAVADAARPPTNSIGRAAARRADCPFRAVVIFPVGGRRYEADLATSLGVWALLRHADGASDCTSPGRVCVLHQSALDEWADRLAVWTCPGQLADVCSLNGIDRLAAAGPGGLAPPGAAIAEAVRSVAALLGRLCTEEVSRDDVARMRPADRLCALPLVPNNARKLRRLGCDVYDVSGALARLAAADRLERKNAAVTPRCYRCA